MQYSKTIWLYLSNFVPPGLCDAVAVSNLLLLLLDFTAAFDTVNHKILISHLEEWVGITDPVLHCFSSFLADRMFCVNIKYVLLLPLLLLLQGSHKVFFRTSFFIIESFTTCSYCLQT